MLNKKIFQIFFLTAILLASSFTTRSALAWSGCGTSYIIQWGDTLGSIATRCGTTISALRLANPSMGYWIYAGQTIWLPGAYIANNNGFATYMVARGDTLKSLATHYNTTMDVLAGLNGIHNYDLIYEGQRLTVPTLAGTYVVQWGDTLRKIAARMNINVNDLIAVNPQLWNPNLIYFGQVIYLPHSASLYTVQSGDTLKIIAGRYGTTLNNLLALNPQIWNADWIYAGQMIRVR